MRKNKFFVSNECYCNEKNKYKEKKVSDSFINDDIAMNHFHNKMLFSDVFFRNNLFMLSQE